MARRRIARADSTIANFAMNSRPNWTGRMDTPVVNTLHSYNSRTKTRATAAGASWMEVGGRDDPGIDRIANGHDHGSDCDDVECHADRRSDLCLPVDHHFDTVSHDSCSVRRP